MDLGVGVLGRMRRCDPHCPPPEGGCPNVLPAPWQVPEGEGGCTGTSLLWGFENPDSGASGVRAAPAGGGGRQAWTELQDSQGLALCLPSS